MPTYELKCQNEECAYVFEIFVPMARYEEEKAKGCPECGGVLEQVFYCSIHEGFSKDKLIVANNDPDDPSPAGRDTSSRTGRAHRRMMQDRFTKRNAELDRLTANDPTARDRMRRFMDQHGVKRNY